MSFADPLWLLALLLVPLALLARWAARERARRYAVRFTAVGSLRAAVAQASRSRWRGWLPAAALLAATVLLVAGLARPHVRHRVPIRDASLMLVLDHSGSMMSTDVAPTRLGAAIRAANDFIDQVPGSIRIGAIGFSSEADAVQRPVRDHAAARALVDAQQAGGGTSTGPALTLALQLLDASKAKHAPAAVVLLSDGAANAGVSPIAVAQQAKREHVPIYTVALGTPGGTINGGGPFSPQIPVPPDPELMSEIAGASGARSFDAQTEDQLSSIYKSLGRRLSTVARSDDITVYVLLAAAALLALTLGAVPALNRSARRS